MVRADAPSVALISQEGVDTGIRRYDEFGTAENRYQRGLA
jgi:hypothetical protein